MRFQGYRGVEWFVAVRFLYLSHEDVLRLDISMGDVMDAVKHSLISHARGQTELPAKVGVHPRVGAFLHAMPAYIKSDDACGIKWVSGFSNNVTKGLPTIMGIMLMNDPDTGQPLALMDCAWLTAVRTAAVSALTAQACARDGTLAIGMVGAGTQARFTLRAFKEALPSVGLVKVFDIREAASRDFSQLLGPELGLEVRPASSVQEAVEGSDIILTATQKLDKPLVLREWFKEGCLGMGLEVARAWDPALLHSVDKVITDDIVQAREFEKLGGFPGGMPRIHAQTGEILAGLAPGRESPGERIIAVNIGIAVTDVAVGRLVHDKAKEVGVGEVLQLMK